MIATTMPDEKKSCKPFKTPTQRTKCVVCGKVLKVFERNLCSCKLNVCMKHKQRVEHGCPDAGRHHHQEMDKVVAPKVVKI
ncbi:unnamed protein product [Sphacelaria rigidula]